MIAALVFDLDAQRKLMGMSTQRIIAIPRRQYPPDPDALALASLVLPGLTELTPEAISALA